MRRLFLAVFLAAAGCGGAGSSDGPTEYEGTGLVLEDAGHGPELCFGGVMESDPVQCRGLTLVGWDWDAVEGDDERRGTRTMRAHVRGTLDGTTLTVTAPPGPPRRQPVIDPTPPPSPACERPSGDPSAKDAGWSDAGVADGPQVVVAWVHDPPDGPFTGNFMVRPGATEEVTAQVRRTYPGLLCVVERDLPPSRELDRRQARLIELLDQMVWWGFPDYQRGVVVAHITLADERTRQKVDAEFGPGNIELTSALTPVKP